MTRQDFLQELRTRLRRLPQEEADNAVSYYEEYLNDAGVENEAQALLSLGPPALVASKIIGEFAVVSAEVVPERTKKRGPHVLLVVLLAVFASPVAIPLGVAAFIIVISIGIVFISFLASAAAITIAGGATILLSIWVFTADFATGVLYLGMGLFTLALGIAATTGMVKISRFTFNKITSWLGGILIRRGAK